MMIARDWIFVRDADVNSLDEMNWNFVKIA